jgi:C1A family cysteine protease
MKAQTIQIDSTFTTDGEIYPFSPDDTIYGLSISGSVALHSDTSLVRVILTDNTGQEWMVYEAYPFINPIWNFTFHELADETMYKEIQNPILLKVEILNASFYLDYITWREVFSENLSSMQNHHKEMVESAKIDSINTVIENNNMLWFAHQTPVSALTYSEKMTRFGEKYNLKGLDFYSGGIYDDVPGVNGERDNSNLVDDFDWRNRHGANDPSKTEFYFDPNSDGCGWLTSVKDQNPYGCNGTCFIHGPLGVIEGVANLYFNQHIDYDLSEQHVLDCDDNYYGPGEGECKGHPSKTSMFVREDGVMDEDAYPRTTYEEDCSEEPPNGPAEYWIKVHDYLGWTNFTNETLKDGLINHGPLIVTIDNYAGGPHSMALVGYGKLKVGDIFHNPSNPSQSTIVDTNSDYIGHLYWILKNSWGYGWGDQGYFYYLAEDAEIVQPLYYELPIDDILTDQDVVIAYDKDHDGYWNWGISESYDLPDEVCSELKDSDDSENRVGPFDENYYSVPVMPGLKVYLKRSLSDIEVTNNSFFSFSASDLDELDQIKFYIENTGNAQLNLKPYGLDRGKVEIETVPGASPNYIITERPRPRICWGYEKKSFFKVEFSGSSQGELTKIKIYLDEHGDIPDFEFILVYNDCQPDQGVIEISGNQYWDSFALKTKDYLILPQATLTVTSEVAMGITSDIFVAPDGKLIIDGGRLTSACPGFWNGVDVWGDQRRYQTPKDQGIVEIKNGGTIEYADTAIATARFSNIYHYPSGGIISCKDAVFKDNTYDVVYYPYNNYHPVTHEIIGNISRFTRTRFETTNDYYDITHSATGAHLKLNEVGGIRFAGCTFNNSSTQKDYSRGIGIESNDAGYTVNNFCTEDFIPCPGERPCLFENLDYGIRAFNSNSYFTINVDSADFVDNDLGIYMSLVNDASVIKNHFYLNADDDYFGQGDILVGIYTERCTRYQIEENKITGLDPGTYKLVGMHILNSEPEYNEIYNNSLTNLYSGIIAAGENRNGDNPKIGLCIKCNDFADCITDVYVTPEGGANAKCFGIATTQGLLGIEHPEGVDPNTVGAGNTFTAEGAINPESNFYNDNDLDQINYIFQYSDFFKLNPVPSNHIEKTEDGNITYEKEKSCPSHLYSGGIHLESEKSILTDEKEILIAYSDTLTQYVDGGDTPGLTFEIRTSSPEDALDLKQQLINESPYLSDTVIKSAIEIENVLPNAMVRDILLLNPQTAKSAELLYTLENKYNPMPDYMIEEILEGKNFLGEKENLERRMAWHDAMESNALASIIQYYKNDTLLTSSKDSVIAYLEFNNSPETQYQLAFCNLSSSDSKILLDILNDIPLDYSLNSQQLVAHELYEDLFNSLIMMQSDSVKIDSTSAVGLFLLMDNIFELPGIYARNILILNNLISYSEPVYLPNVLKNSHDNEKNINKVFYKESYLKAYPNPTKSYIIIEYVLDNASNPAIITILDASGKSLYTRDIQDTQNQYVIDTQTYPPGIYMVSLLIGNQVLDFQKFIRIQ